MTFELRPASERVRRLVQGCHESLLVARRIAETFVSVANVPSCSPSLQLQATQAADTAAAVREADLRIQLAMATSALATWQTKAQRAHAQLTEADATWRAEKERLQAAASSSNATWQADVHRLEAALAAAESHQEELSERSAGLEARLADLKASAAAAAKEGAAEDAAAAREEAAAAWKDAAAAQQEAEAAARREAELKGAYEKVQAEVRMASDLNLGGILWWLAGVTRSKICKQKKAISYGSRGVLSCALLCGGVDAG